MKEKLKNITLRKSLLITLILIIMGETLYFGYFFIIKRESLNHFIEEKIKLRDIDIKTLKNMKIDNSINGKTSSNIKKRFQNKKYAFGVTTTGVAVEARINKTGSPFSYYRVRIGFRAKSYSAIKTFILLLYADKNLVKITELDTRKGSVVVYFKESNK